LEKTIYFGGLVFLDSFKGYIPLEWIQPYKDSHDLLISVEAGLIYHFNPELNTQSVKKNYSGIPINLNIENWSGTSKFLHGEQVFI
jgi:hypothetical protein